MKGILNVLYVAILVLATLGGAGYAIMADAGVIAFACVIAGVLTISDYFGWLTMPKWPK